MRAIWNRRRADRRPRDPFTAEVERALGPAQDYARSHGGRLQLVEADAASGAVRIRLRGACAACPLSSLTIKYGVEERLRAAVPTLSRVEVLNG